MAGHRKLEPAAKRRAMDRRHQRLRAIFDLAQPGVYGARTLERGFTRGDGFKKTDVGTRNECRPGADQHYGARLRIGSGAFDRGIDGLGHSWAQSIDRRVIDGEDCHLVANFITHKFRHGVCHLIPRQIAYLGTVPGLPFSAIRNTRNFTGSVVLAFFETA